MNAARIIIIVIVVGIIGFFIVYSQTGIPEKQPGGIHVTGGYGAPSGGYGAPSGGYGAPSGGYGAPSGGYGAPSGGYGR